MTQHRLSLSFTEMQVLNLLGQGMARTAVAKSLLISESTVRTRINSIMLQLEMPAGSDVAATVKKARACGLLPEQAVQAPKRRRRR